MTSAPETIEGAAPHVDSFITSGPRNRWNSASARNDGAKNVAAAAEGPCTLTGKRPTAAALLREREYMDWLATLVQPARDDQTQDDSHAAFMAQRRQRSEHERSKLRAQQRREQRHARGLQRKPAGQGRNRARGRIGRPVNPDSKRQQLIVMRAQRKVERSAVQLRQEQEWRAKQHDARLERERAADLNAAHRAERQLQRQRDARLNELLAMEHNLPLPLASQLTAGQRSSSGQHQLSARELCADEGGPLLPESILSADGTQERAQLLYDLLDTAARCHIGAYWLAQHVKRTAFPEVLLPRVMVALVLEYLKPQKDRSCYRGMAVSRGDDAVAESLALADQAKRRRLAEWVSDERIDREHPPPRLSHVRAADRERDCVRCVAS